jgi:hypothetical protein
VKIEVVIGGQDAHHHLIVAEKEDGLGDGGRGPALNLGELVGREGRRMRMFLGVDRMPAKVFSNTVRDRHGADLLS